MKKSGHGQNAPLTSGPVADHAAVSTPRIRAWLLILLALTGASNFMDRIVVATVSQAMKLDLQLTDLQLGLLGGMAFAFFYAILGIPLARLSDTRNRVRLLSACVALWSLLTTLCGAAQNYLQLLLLRVGVGIGEAGSTPASHSLIADHWPAEKRASAFAMYALGVPLGVFCGAIGAGWIVQSMGWRAAFFILGIPGILLALLVLVTLREPPRGLSDGTNASTQPVPPLREVLLTVLRKPTFLHLSFGCALIGFANFGINMFMPIYFTRVFEMSYAQAGLAFGLITGIGAMVGTSVGGFMADWAGKRDPRWYLWVVALAVAITTPFYLLAFVQNRWPVAAAMMLVFGCMMYSWYGATFAVAYRLVGARMRAQVSALVLLVSTLIGQGLGPVFIGGASDALTRRAWGDDNHALICAAHALEQAGQATFRACTQASATGIRQASVLCGLVFLWGALHYFLASRTLTCDQELAP